jgi:hypothetical protein
MTDYEIERVLNARASASGAADTRYVFTSQFLAAAAQQSRLAFAIEAKPPTDVTGADDIAHRGYVVAALMQAVAALESEIWELTHHGPGYHLGSDEADVAARDFLAPITDVIDKVATIPRYDLLLHLLRKQPLDHGALPYQDANLVVRLRNEIVHYKSKWGEELSGEKLFRALEGKHLPKPPFLPPTGMNFFPQHCLSAATAAWAVETCVGFLDAVYDRIGVPCPWQAQRPLLNPRA